MIDKEILEIKNTIERRSDDVAKEYVKHLASIIKQFGSYRAANTYRPRITLREHLRFIYRRRDFLIENLPFSGKWFQTGNLMIGQHRYYNQKGWHGAVFIDYHVYEDHKEVLWVSAVHCSDGWGTHMMKHLGHITSDLVQHILRLSDQAIQECRKQREPEIQELEQQLKRLGIAETGLGVKPSHKERRNPNRRTD